MHLFSELIVPSPLKIHLCLRVFIWEEFFVFRKLHIIKVYHSPHELVT